MRLALVALLAVAGTARVAQAVPTSLRRGGDASALLEELMTVRTGEDGDKEESVRNILARVQHLYLRMKKHMGGVSNYDQFLKDMRDALNVMSGVKGDLNKDATVKNNALAHFFLDSINSTYEQTSDMYEVLSAYDDTAKGLLDILSGGESAAAAGDAGRFAMLNSLRSTTGRMEVAQAYLRQQRIGREYQWTDVRFQHSFKSVPVVVLTPDRRGGHPAAIRVRDVTRYGFRAAIVEPPGSDGPHTWQRIAYLAVSQGVHAMPDGTVLEAGLHATSHQQHDPECGKHLAAASWDRLEFKAPFQATPALLTQIQTMRNEESSPPTSPSMPWLTVATHDLDRSGAKVALERTRTRSGRVRQPEVVGYVAVQQTQSAYLAADMRTVVNYESLVTPRVIRGWQDSVELVYYRAPMSGNIVFASMASRNDPEGGWIRVHTSSTWWFRLVKDKDVHCVAQRHAAEPDHASVLSFNRYGSIDLRPLTAHDLADYARNAIASPAMPSFTNFDNATIKAANLAPDKAADPGVNLEMAHQRLYWAGRNNGFRSFNFNQRYRVPPLLFMQPDSRGGRPIAPRVDKITETGFSAGMVAAPPHPYPGIWQDVHYIALEPGVHTLPDGTVLEAGYVDTTKHVYNAECVTDDDAPAWEHIKFKAKFKDPPTVLVFVQTMANELNRVPDQASEPWLTAVSKEITPRGVKVALERSSVTGGRIRVPERLAYLAIDHTSGSFRDQSNREVYYSSNTYQPVTLGWGNGCQNLPLRMQVRRSAYYVGSKNSRFNDEGGWPRSCGSWNWLARMRIDTDQSCTKTNNNRQLARGEIVSLLSFSYHTHLHTDVMPVQSGKALIMEEGEDQQDKMNKDVEEKDEGVTGDDTEGEAEGEGEGEAEGEADEN